MKQNFLKKLTSLILVAMMVIALLPASLFAVSAAAGDWNLVTDATTLAEGDTIIIVNTAATHAISTTQQSNNRKATTVTSGTNTVTIGDDVQQFTLVKGTKDNTFSFYTGSNYIYAASGSSNHLKSQTTNNDNSSWTISISSTGEATILAQGTNSRNVLRYNPNNNNPVFSCYSSSSTVGSLVSIYKLEKAEVAEHSCAANLVATPANDAKCDEAGNSAYWTCSVCEKNYSDDAATTEIASNSWVIAAPGHTYKKVEGTDVAATCTEDSYYTEKCETCQETRKYTNFDTATGHDFGADGKCQNVNCDAVKPALPQVGDVVYFTGSKSNGDTYELTGYDTDDKIGIATLYTDNPTVSYPLTVVAGSATGSVAFKTTDGKYLSWNTSVTNKLIITDSVTADSSWNVTLDADNEYVIANVGTSERKLQFNSGSPRFACYTTDQAAVNIVFVAPEAKEWSLTLNGTIGVNVYYNIDAAWLAANAGAQVVFNGKVTVDAVKGLNKYTYEVSPEKMADEITVQLMVGEKEVLKNKVSVQAYIDYQQANLADGTPLKKLVDAMEVYGAAAVDYVNKKAVDKVEGSVANIIGLGNSTSGTTVAQVTEWSVTLTGSTALNFLLTLGDSSANHTLTVTLGGVEIVKDAKLADYMNGNTLTISNLSVLDFEKELVITIGDGAATTVIHAYAQRYVETRSKDTIENYEYNLLVALDAYRAAAKAYFASVAA